MAIEASRVGVASALVTEYAKAAPGANTTFSTFKVSPVCGMVRITVALTTSSVLNLTVTDGTTAYVLGLNGSVALAAGDVYSWVLPLRYTSNGDDGGTGLTYGFQVETDSVVRLLFVDLVTGNNT